MTLDPPAALNTMPRQIAEARQQSVDTVSLQAKVTTSRLLEALVLQVVQASPKQRQALQQSFAPLPARAEPSLLSMLQSPKLVLAELELDHQSRLIFTDKALQPNTKVQVEVAADGRLRLLDGLSKGGAPQVDRELQLLARVDILSKSLREALPKHEVPKHELPKQEMPAQGTSKPATGSELFQVLERAVQLKPQEANREARLLSQILRLMQALPKTPAELQKPGAMRQAIRDSGVFLESKLLNSVVRSKPDYSALQKNTTVDQFTTGKQDESRSTSPIISTPRPMSPSSPALVQALRTLASQQVNAQQKTQPPLLRADSKPAPAAEIKTDVKANLLLAKTAIEAVLDKNSGFINDSALIPRLKSALAERDFTAALKILLAPPEPNTPKEKPTAGQQHNLRPLVQLVHQQLISALARIQVQQARTLMQSTSNETSGTTTVVQHCEIPVRTDAGIQQVQVRWEQDWVEAKDKKTEEVKQVRQWNVMLSFDLPNAGAFYARLKMLGEQISIQFWADRDSTLQEAKEKLTALRSELVRHGLGVADIQCMPGAPPQFNTSLSYALVDVKT